MYEAVPMIPHTQVSPPFIHASTFLRFQFVTWWGSHSYCQEVTCNIHPIHEPVYGGGGGLTTGMWGEGGGGRCGVGYIDGEASHDYDRRGLRGESSRGAGVSGSRVYRGGGEHAGGAVDDRDVGDGGDGGRGGDGGGVRVSGDPSASGGAPRWRSWNHVLATHAARDEGEPAFEFAFHRVVVKCAPQMEWPAETNVETHWSWDLRTETVERSFEACCLSDLVVDDRVLAMLIPTGDHQPQYQPGQAEDTRCREFSVVLRNIDTGDLVVEQALPPFPRSYGGITKFSVCNTPRPGTGSKVWHGLIEFADERHLAEFGCGADGVPFAHVHCLSPHARFCSLGCPNYSFPIGSAQDGDKLYLVARDVVPGWGRGPLTPSHHVRLLAGQERKRKGKGRDSYSSSNLHDSMTK